MQAEDAPAVETSPIQLSAPSPPALTASVCLLRPSARTLTFLQITALQNGSAATESRLAPALTTPQYNFDPAQPMVDASMLDLLGNFDVNPFSDGIETSYSGISAFG